MWNLLLFRNRIQIVPRTVFGPLEVQNGKKKDEEGRRKKKKEEEEEDSLSLSGVEGNPNPWRRKRRTTRKKKMKKKKEEEEERDVYP